MIPRRPLIARGLIRYLILYVLQDGPKTGYEIIKAVEKTFKGVYRPSPGLIYPNLSYLAEKGYIEREKIGDRSLYRVTELGIKALKEKKEYVEKHIEKARKVGRRILPVKDLFAIVGMLMSNYEFLDDDQKTRIANILSSTRREIEKVIGGLNECCEG